MSKSTRITARLKVGCGLNEQFVGCKALTRQWLEFDVTDSELTLFERSTIAEFKIVKPKPEKSSSTKSTPKE